MRERKEMAAPWQNGYSRFSFGCKTYKQPEGKGQTKHPSGPPKMTANNPKNIREPILDFTSHLGEINPDMPYLCRRGLSGPERAVFASFPSVRRETMKKSLNRRFFAKNK